MRSNTYHNLQHLFVRHLFFIIILTTGILVGGNVAKAQTRTYTSSGSFTVPAGVTSIIVNAVGGGGGGSQITSTNRRGGGGGGGAYAGSTVTVTPGITYTITVGTGGSSNTSGGNSSFGTLVVAEGGDGGASNNTGAGAGGTTAGSTGTTKYKGGNGAAGGASLSGAGGGGAGTTGAGNNASTSTAGGPRTLYGGAGGAGVSGGNAGNDGLDYGAGGSGGNANSGTNRAGGTGANGIVVISWNCPSAYAISSVTASSICPVAGPSVITLNSSTLPTGNYIVTYDLSAPNAATGLTATMAFTAGTPGSGTFNTTTLTTPATTTITITNLQSGGAVNGTGQLNCGNTISAGNTANIVVNATPVITGSTGGQRCNTGTVSISATANAGSVVDWYANASGGAVLAGGTGTNNFTTPSITGTTIYYAQARNTSAGCISLTRTAVTATVNAVPAQPSVIATAAVCAGSTQTYSVTNVAGINYTWSMPAGWTIISGQGTNSVTVTTGTVSGVTISVTPDNGACSGPVRTSSAITVSSNSTPANQPTGPVAFTNTVSSISGTFILATGSPTGYLVIRKENATPPSAPVDGTAYTPGTIALGGVIDKFGAGNTFISTGLAPNTTYYYWIYSYNAPGACVTYPMYRQVSPLTASTTTSNCSSTTTLYWRGKTSTVSSATSSVDFNLATNWSVNSTTYSNPSSLVPNACTDIVMNLNMTSSNNADITFSQAATVIRSLTTNFSASGGGSLKSFKIITLNQTVTVLGNTVLNTNNSGVNSCQTEIDVSTGGVFTYGGDLTTNFTRVGAGYAYNYPFSNRIPEISQGKVVLKGNATLRGVGNDVTPQLNKPDYFVFDGTGTQTITNENVFISGYYDAIHLGHHTVIGELNTPAVIFTGSGTEGFTTVEDFFINNGASLNIRSSQKFNRLSLGGTFKLLPGATLKVDGVTGGETGSTFPSNFSSHDLAPSSTVEYNGEAGTTQTIFSGVTYGNLVLSNSTGSGNATKILSGNIAGIIGNLTIDNATTFDQGSYTANRTAAGGTFTITGAGTHKLGGNSGGASAGNNYPGGFGTLNIATGSNTEYNGAAQTIHGSPEYGNLTIANAGIKTAPSGTLTVKGDLVNSGASFAHNNGKVLLNGAGQSFAGLPFYELDLATSGTKTMTGAASIEHKLALTSATAITLALGNNDLSLLSTSGMTASVTEIPTTASITYGTGRFIVERYMPAKKAWRFVATPVKAGTKIYDTWQEGGATSTGRGLQITGPAANPTTNGMDVTTPGNSLKYYNPAVSGGFSMVNNTKTTDLANEKGYMVFVRGDRTATVASGTNNTTVLRTRGELITGNKTYVVPANGLASVGNPYASRIDLKKVYSNGGIGGASNVTASVTVWDPQVGVGPNGVGIYRTYTRNTSGDFELTPGGAINNYIESGQAFYVQSLTGGTLALTENTKADGSTNAARSGNSVMSRLRTDLWAPDPDTTWALADGTLTDTDDQYSNGIDNMDVRKTMNKDENVSILSGGKSLIVERKKHFILTDTIFYNMSGMKQQTYEFRFAPENLSPLLIGYLEDRYLNTSTPVSLTTNTIIPFTITSVAASSAVNRFKLVFKPAAIVLPVTFTAISANRNTDRSIAVNWKVENETNIEKYTVERSADGTSFTGILTADPTGSNAYTKHDLSPLAADNYYRIKATSIGGKIQYSAIVKVAPDKTNPQISVYPNPVAGKKMQVQFTNQPKGLYQLQLTNKLGQLIYNGSVQVTGSNMVRAVQLNDNTAAGTYQLTVSSEGEKGMTMQVIIE